MTTRLTFELSILYKFVLRLIGKHLQKSGHCWIDYMYWDIHHWKNDGSNEGFEEKFSKKKGTRYKFKFFEFVPSPLRGIRRRIRFEFVPSPFRFVRKIFVCTVPPGTILISFEFKIIVPKFWQLVFYSCRFSKRTQICWEICPTDTADLWEILPALMLFLSAPHTFDDASSCCSVRRWVTVCCSVLQRVAACFCVFSRVSLCCSMHWHVFLLQGGEHP